MTREARNRAALLLILVVATACAGCGRETAEHEHEHEAGEEAHTGPHGGALVTLPAETVHAAGIVVDSVRSRPIEVTVELPAEIKLNAEHSVDVRPTYPGRVHALNATLGSFVRDGQALAVVYSNESLSDYTVVAPMSGTVVARPAAVGSVVDPTSTLYTVADLSTVWLEFPIYVQHLGHIRRGQLVHVRGEGGSDDVVTAPIQYVGPLLDANTRTTFGRVVLSNRDGRWQPGRLASAVVVLERVTAPLTVPEDAIVRLGSGSAVFRADSSGFELQPVIVGRSDGTTTEIVSGLELGARVVAKNAFLLKAELEKEAGGHED